MRGEGKLGSGRLVSLTGSERSALRVGQCPLPRHQERGAEPECAPTAREAQSVGRCGEEGKTERHEPTERTRSALAHSSAHTRNSGMDREERADWDVC